MLILVLRAVSICCAAYYPFVLFCSLLSFSLFVYIHVYAAIAVEYVVCCHLGAEACGVASALRYALLAQGAVAVELFYGLGK